MEKVILVDEQDKAIGAMDKMEAHRRGILHRAFSILIFNSKGEVLLQKRSKNKYHSGELIFSLTLIINLFIKVSSIKI